jgi:membrane protein DedA with SNARE-associated domain
MQALESYFLSLPPNQILFMLAGLIILTCLSIVPSNNDLNQLVAGVMAGFGYLKIQSVYFVCLASIVLGEAMMYSVGFFLGKYLLEMKIVKNFVKKDHIDKIKNLIEKNAFLFFLGLRLTPVLRAIIVFIVGSVQVKPKLYLRYHLPLSVIYSSCLTLISFYFANSVRQHFDEYKFHIMGIIVLIWLFILRRIFSKINARLV